MEEDDGEKAATAGSDDLCSFLEGESNPARKELANRPLIRERRSARRSIPMKPA